MFMSQFDETTAARCDPKTEKALQDTRCARLEEALRQIVNDPAHAAEIARHALGKDAKGPAPVAVDDDGDPIDA